MRAGIMIAAALSAAGTAQAETRGGFTVGLEAFDYGYRERLDGLTIVRDDGAFGGLIVDYVETVGAGNFLRARVAAAWGSVDYRDDEGDRIDDVAQEITSLEFHVGHDFSLGQGSVSPFIGLGGRLLVDNSGGETSSGGNAGYDREINYAYVPVGVALSAPVGEGWRITGSAQVNLLLGGRVDSDFSTVSPELPNVRVDLNGGTGFEASVALAKRIGGSEIAFGPFVRRWTIDRSHERTVSDGEDTLIFFEPRNRTTELGLRLTVAF